MDRGFTKTELLDLAREVVTGLDVGVFTDVLRHSRFGDVHLALGDVDLAALRAFFQRWITDLDVNEQ